MKTYGTIRYHEGFWFIKAEPHVMIKAKAILGRVNPQQFGEVSIKDSAQVCRDLEWFAERYPLVLQDEARLKKGSRQYKATLQALEEINKPNYHPVNFQTERPLRQYQATAVEIYLKNKKLLCADQLGLGKTAIGIGSFTDRRTLPAIVVVQTHLAKQWKDQLGLFLPFCETHIIKKRENYGLPDADVYIVTYSKLDAWVEVLSKFCKSIVFDECQELRHNGTVRHAAAKHLADLMSFRMGLSATPIYNYGGEIFNVLDVVCPDSIGTKSEFEREWCEHNGGHALLKDPEAFGAHLRDQFIMVRRTRKEVGRELPEKQKIIQTIEHSEEALDAIKDVATELAHRILEGTYIEQGQAARDFDMKLRQATGIAKAPYVAGFVNMLVEDGQTVLLTGWHRDVYDVWKKHLSSECKAVMFTGTESPLQKDEARKKFLSGEAKVFIMSLRSGAGLDGLQDVCSVVCHAELDWSPQVHDQVTGRLTRDGQKNNVAEYFLVSDAGSDPMMAEVLGIKEAQSVGLLDPGGIGLKKLRTDDGARIKRMAENYLNKRPRLTV